MKKLIQSLCLATMAAFTFNACSDVPAPYDIPGSGTQNNGVYISESFSNTLGDFKSISAEGNLSWTIDYSSACITGYNSTDKTNTAGITYLVSPTIDLSQSSGAYISFSHAINYERGDLAANNQLVISKDFTGDVTKATWQALTFNTTGTNNDFTFVSSGKVSIPAEYIGSNTVTVALRHTCTETSSSTWEVKSFKVAEGQGEDIGGEETGDILFSADFSSDMCGFTIKDVNKPAAIENIWIHDAGYSQMKASAYVNSTNYASESWLISPSINLKEASAATLTFEHAGNFFKDIKADISLWISEAGKENWTELEIPTYPSGNNWTFVKSGDINLSAYKGKDIMIAFKYTSTAEKAGTYEVKNIKIEEREAEEQGGETPDEPGESSKDNPYSVTTAISKFVSGKAQDVWVKGYIVGYVDGMSIEEGARFNADGVTSNTNLLIASNANETNVANCMPVQLPSGDLRSKLNLKDHPENLGKEITLHGSLEAYFKVAGLKSPTEYILEGEEGGGETEEPEQKTTFVKVTDITDGTYIMAAASSNAYKVAKNISADYNYGYFYVENASATNDAISLASEGKTFVITKTDNGYTIVDENNKYVYMTGSFNSFNVSATPNEGQYWDIVPQGDGTFKISNKLNNKWIQYSEQYTSFGCYSNQTGTLPSLFKKK